MAAENSNQYARTQAMPRQMVSANEWGGRFHRYLFSFKQGTAAVGTGTFVGPDGPGTQNDTILLVPLKAGWRMVGGLVLTEAFGASCTLAIGDIGSGQADGAAVAANKFMAATDVSGISSTAFNNTIALLWGLEIVNDFVLTGTIAGAAVAAGKMLRGYIDVLFP